jgi:hypothetical protein
MEFAISYGQARIVTLCRFAYYLNLIAAAHPACSTRSVGFGLHFWKPLAH